MKLTKIDEVDDSFKFWRGTVIREYNIGLNVDDKLDDFYDYMLVHDPITKDFMFLVNISFKTGKAGAVRSYIKYFENNMYTTKNEIIFKLGSKHIYLVENFELENQ